MAVVVWRAITEVERMSVDRPGGSNAEIEERLFEQISSLRRVRALRLNVMCKILPNLYLGSIFDATDPEQMDSNEVVIGNIFSFPRDGAKIWTY